MVGPARWGVFFGLLTVLLAWWGVLATTGLLVVTANAADGGAPATTRVSDTVFRADDMALPPGRF